MQWRVQVATKETSDDSFEYRFAMGRLHSQLQGAVSRVPLNFGDWQPQSKVQQLLQDILVTQRLCSRLERFSKLELARASHLLRQ
ncbi:hypothetical protein EMIT0158MI4_20633 [Burkholderia ambifaria]